MCVCVRVCDENKSVLQKSLNSPLIVSFFSPSPSPPLLLPLSLSLCLCEYSVTHGNVGRYGIIFRLPDSFCYSDSGANISHAVVVLPMSPLPWKRCIRGSGKAGCPSLIGRQGGRSLLLPPPLVFPVSSSCVLFSKRLQNRMCQNAGASAAPPRTTC